MKADEIESWLESILQSFIVILMNAPMFRVWARLMLKKSDDLLIDAMIAATALVHGLTVVTRNVRDFEQFGVTILNPFENP